MAGNRGHQKIRVFDSSNLRESLPRNDILMKMDGMDEQPNKGLPESSGLPSGSIRRAIRAEWLQTKSARVERITERFDPKRK